MAPKKLSKPKGTYSKVGGVGGTKFTGSSPMDKFQNFLVNTDETTETRKERFENPSRLYAAARKLGIPEKSIKKQIDDMAKYQAKYGAGVEKKTSKMDMEDMMRRSKANSAAKKKAAVKKSTSYSPAPMSAAAKKKAAAAGKKTQSRMLVPIKEPGRVKAGSSTVSKVVKRAKTTAREARDIATAVGTVGNAAYNTIYYDKNPLNITKTSKKNLSGSVKNLVKQVKETRTAAKTGAKGTTSAKSGGRGDGYKFTTKSGGTFEERKLKPGTKRK